MAHNYPSFFFYIKIDGNFLVLYLDSIEIFRVVCYHDAEYEFFYKYLPNAGVADELMMSVKQRSKIIRENEPFPKGVLSLLKYYCKNETSGMVTSSPEENCQLFSGDSVGIEVTLKNVF